MRDPYTGGYGQVSASDAAAWLASHQHRLLPRPASSLPPARFRKTPTGGTTRETGFFESPLLRLVNAAQTVGAISRAAAKDAEKVAKARVAIRLVALEEGTPCSHAV